jgi:hypothetical protein
MPLTPAQVRGAITSNPWTKDFRHLQPFPLNSLKRYSFKDILPKASKPNDRIKYWNIVPGDRVKILGDKDGKILEVAKINKLSNRVYLKGSTAKVCSISTCSLYSRVDLRVPFARSKAENEGGLKNVHYSRCQLFIGDFEFPPKGKATESRTLPYVRPSFLSFVVYLHCLIVFPASSQSVLALLNPTGNLWAPAMNGSALRQERHPDSPVLPVHLAVLKFPGRSD